VDGREGYGGAYDSRDPIKFQLPILREDTPESEAYFNTIKDPQDLQTITARIRRRDYTSLDKWLQDVETCWANSDKYDNDPVHLAVSDECRRVFENILRSSGLYPHGDWCRDFFELREWMDRKIQTIPGKIRQLVMSGRQGRRKEEKTTSQSELQILAQAIAVLPEESKLDLAIILGRNGDLPDNGKDVCWVDLATIKSKTFLELQKFVSDVLMEKALKCAQRDDHSE
jgi:hypothetical protein